MIRPRKKWPLLIAALCCSASLSLASSGRLDAAEETAVQVAQPIWTEDGIVLSSVTFILWLGSSVPEIEVAWTAKPNLIQREGDRTPSNRNAASLYHIDVRTLPRAHSDEKFDTMAVVLDLSQMTTRDSSLYHPEDQVINATVEAILLNAAHGHPPIIKYVDLEVEGGPPEYHRLSKVYAVNRTPQGGSR